MATTKATTAPKATETKATAAKAPKVETTTTAPNPALPTAEADAILAAANNAPSQLHKNMQAWLAEAGVEADLETVKLVCALRHTFQKSETNQSHLVDRKSAAEAKLQEKATKAQERLAKAQAAADAAAKAATK